MRTDLNRLLLAAGVLVLAALAAFPALAQTLDAVGGLLQTSLARQVIEVAIVTLGPLVVGGGLAVLARLYALLGLQQTEKNRATAEQVLSRSVDFARARYGIGALGLIPSHMKESAYRAAAEYALDRGPQALSKIGITSLDSQSLQNMLEGRFVEHFEPKFVTPSPTR